MGGTYHKIYLYFTILAKISGCGDIAFYIKKLVLFSLLLTCPYSVGNISLNKKNV